MSYKDYYYLKSFTTREAYYYDIRVAPSDFIWATFEEESGMVALTGSFCDVVHAWPIQGRGKGTIRDFFLGVSAGYLADKFSYGQESSFRERFSAEGTTKNIIEHMKRTIRLDEDPDDEWIGILEDIDDEHDSYCYIDEIKSRSRELFEYLDGRDSIYSWLVNVPSGKYVVLENLVIPRVKEVLQMEKDNGVVWSCAAR